MKYLWTIRYKVKKFIQTLTRMELKSPLKVFRFELKIGSSFSFYLNIGWQKPYNSKPLTFKARSLNAWNNPDWESIKWSQGLDPSNVGYEQCRAAFEKEFGVKWE